MIKTTEQVAQSFNNQIKELMKEFTGLNAQFFNATEEKEFGEIRNRKKEIAFEVENIRNKISNLNTDISP